MNLILLKRSLIFDMDTFQFLFEFTCYTTLPMWSRDNINVYERRLWVRTHFVPAAGAEPAAVATRPALRHRSPTRAAELRGLIRDPRLCRRLPPRARLERFLELSGDGDDV